MSPKFTPVILHTELTADLYTLVIFSVAPGKRVSAIVGPRGATPDQVREAVERLAANIT